MMKRLLDIQRFRFIVSGTAGGVLYYGLAVLLIEFFEVYYVFAFMLCLSLQWVVNFFLHLFWTFTHQKSQIKIMLMHMLFFLFLLSFEMFMIWVMVEFLYFHYALAAILAALMLVEPSYRVVRIIFKKEKHPTK